MKKGKSPSLAQQLLAGDRIALAKAITLAESTSPRHQKEAQKILDTILPHTGKSLRIGITGVPGAGKSTFIETLGNYLIRKKNKKVAVLAVDPSSPVSGGSILGDKTRMHTLARNQHAFIRPSPASAVSGGVGLHTREAILLCEAAGYDIVIVETIGVGQSETAVHDLVDFLLLLLLPGAGDELQGIKRGIIELADLLAVNKADGDNEDRAHQAQVAYFRAMQLFPSHESGWKPPVLTCSALTGKGIENIWKQVESFENLTRNNGFFDRQRQLQRKSWLQQLLTTLIIRKFYANRKVRKSYEALQQLAVEGKISVPAAASRLVKLQRLTA
ncbi:MAG: ATPase/protein kinase [Chitinophagales bacterium]|nr:MAG: ATPase/protein kinase [Chitinophagales bacterium]